MASELQQANAVGMSVKSKELDYDQKLFHHPSYNYNLQQPNTYGAPIALSASQTQTVINLPAEVFNLSKSFLQFKLTLPLVANRYIWMYEDVFSGAIQHIQLYSNSNEYLCDLDNVGNYIKATKKEYSWTELASMDPTYGMYQSNVLANTVPALRNANSISNANPPVGPAPSQTNYTESAYFSVGALGAARVRTYNLNLALLKNTIFSMDKDFYLGGQIAYMRIYWAPLSKICYQSTSNASPSAGTPEAYTGVAPVIENFQLMLAMESNTNIIQSTKAEFTAGKSMMIPYPQNYKNSNSGPSETITIQFDIGLGETLQKVYHQVYNNQEALDTAYDCSNNGTLVDGSPNSILNQKTQQFYTQLNGVRQQNLTMDCTGVGNVFTDYMQMKKLLKGSIIETLNAYQFNWVWCDDYTGYGAQGDQEGRENLIAGIPLGASPLTWSYYGVVMTPPLTPGGVASQYQHYTTAVFMRRLNINSKGAFVGNRISPP